MASNTQDTQPAPKQAPWPHPLAVGALRTAKTRAFDLTADAEDRARIAAFLDLADLSALRFRGKLEPDDDDGWTLTGRLTAALAQHCVVTLEPVPEQIDERIVRQFVPEDVPVAIDLDPEADDEPDSFTDTIDPGAVAVEELALALDPYPHAEEAGRVEMRATPPGAAVLDDAALKPFAGLADLKAKLEGKD